VYRAPKAVIRPSVHGCLTTLCRNDSLTARVEAAEGAPHIARQYSWKFLLDSGYGHGYGFGTIPEANWQTGEGSDGESTG